MNAPNENLHSKRSNWNLMLGMFTFMDGGSVLCADYEESDVQNAYYKVYTGNVEITNLLVLNLFGELIHATVNCIGSSHDRKLAT